MHRTVARGRCISKWTEGQDLNLLQDARESVPCCHAYTTLIFKHAGGLPDPHLLGGGVTWNRPPRPTKSITELRSLPGNTPSMPCPRLPLISGSDVSSQGTQWGNAPADHFMVPATGFEPVSPFYFRSAKRASLPKPVMGLGLPGSDNFQRTAGVGLGSHLFCLPSPPALTLLTTVSS